MFAERFFDNDDASRRGTLANAAVGMTGDQNGRHRTSSTPQALHHVQTIHRWHVIVDDETARGEQRRGRPASPWSWRRCGPRTPRSQVRVEEVPHCKSSSSTRTVRLEPAAVSNWFMTTRLSATRQRQSETKCSARRAEACLDLAQNSIDLQSVRRGGGRQEAEVNVMRTSCERLSPASSSSRLRGRFRPCAS